MSSLVQESYSPVRVTASGPLMTTAGGAIGGFLCSVSGTLTLYYADIGEIGTDGRIVVGETPVTAGVFLPLPFTVPIGEFAYAVLGGGAQGTFGVS